MAAEPRTRSLLNYYYKRRQDIIRERSSQSYSSIGRSLSFCICASPLLSCCTFIPSYSSHKPTVHTWQLTPTPSKLDKPLQAPRCRLRKRKFLLFRQVEVDLPIPHLHLPPPAYQIPQYLLWLSNKMEYRFPLQISLKKRSAVQLQQALQILLKLLEIVKCQQKRTPSL